MRFFLKIASVAAVVVSLTAFPGCGSQTPASKPAAGHSEGDGHDHSKDSSDHQDHDHEKEGEHK